MLHLTHLQSSCFFAQHSERAGEDERLGRPGAIVHFEAAFAEQFMASGSVAAYIPGSSGTAMSAARMSVSSDFRQ